MRNVQARIFPNFLWFLTYYICIIYVFYICNIEETDFLKQKKGRENLSPEKPATTGLSARIAAEAWQQPRRDIAVKPYRLLVYRKTSPSELSSRLAPESSSVPAGGIGGEDQRTPVFLNVLKRGWAPPRVLANIREPLAMTHPLKKSPDWVVFTAGHRHQALHCRRFK